MLTLPLPLKLIPRPLQADGPWDLQPGDCWYTSLDDHIGPNGWKYWFEREVANKHLSDYYWANNAWRMPMCVIVPGQQVFCLDSKCVNNGVYSGGWSVHGTYESQTLTVSPSINMGGTYHGYIQNNMLMAEVEGRQYNDDGSHYRP